MDIQRLGGGITVHSGWALIAPWRNQRTKLERWWWDFKFDHLASVVSLKFFFHIICYKKLSSICNLVSRFVTRTGTFPSEPIAVGILEIPLDTPRRKPNRRNWPFSCGIFMWNFPRDFMMAFQMFCWGRNAPYYCAPYNKGWVRTSVDVPFNFGGVKMGEIRPSLRTTGCDAPCLYNNVTLSCQAICWVSLQLETKDSSINYSSKQACFIGGVF